MAEDHVRSVVDAAHRWFREVTPPVRVQHTDPHGEIATLTVRVSYDDGTTGRSAPLVRDGGQRLAFLRHQAPGLVTGRGTR